MNTFEEAAQEVDRLKVALVHSFYSSRNPSGENAAVVQQAQALKRAGHSVEIFGQRTDERELSSFYQLEAALTVATGHGPKPRLSDFNPDVVHIHNLFPNYGKSWIKDVSAPVVTTLHNYRPLCAAGTFYRDGGLCTECRDKDSSVPAVTHGCYRGKVGSVPVAIGQRFGSEPVLRYADAVIVLSEQMWSHYAKAGVPWARMHTLPNFLPADLDGGAQPGGGDYWLYAGRFSEEKGLVELLEKWPSGHELKVVGSGQLEPEVRANAVDNVEVVGTVERPRLLELMRGAKGLVFPSRCLEGFPLIYAESLSVGTPILTWAPSVVSALVDSEGTGLVGGAERLEDTIEAASELFPTLRAHCRTVYDARYTENQWVSALGDIYKSVLS